jgi:flagellar biosynthetic protein FlhB
MAESGGAGGQEAAEDRTEAPTPRRIEKAREEGQVALSREAVALASLAGGMLAMAAALPPLGLEALRGLRGVLEGAHRLAWDRAAAELPWLALLAVAPVAGAAALGAVAATLLQTRGLVSGRLLRPQLSRLSPRAALKRIVGVDAAVELARTLLKLGAVGAALWWALPSDAAPLMAVLHLPAGGLLAAAGTHGLRLLLAALGALSAVAALDLLWVRLRHLRQLRMSRQDLPEEMRESEGDPQVKARLKQIRLARSRRRMLAARCARPRWW